MCGGGARMLKTYTLGFEPWGCALFLLVMMPTVIWSAVPAPNDVLRATSVTPRIDAIGSVCQVLLIATVCCVRNKKRKTFRASPLVVGMAFCYALYVASWVAYYGGVVNAAVIAGLSVPPCFAFLFFALDRKNTIALVPLFGFTVCHLLYAAVNFMR